MSTATPTAPPTGTQASLPFRAAVRWYQLAVIVLGLALAAVTALAISFALNQSTAGTVHPGPVTEQPCWQSQVAC